MLNDFDGMTQEQMMECAEKLESPLKRLEEETKAKEAAEKKAAKKAQVVPDAIALVCVTSLPPFYAHF